MQPEKKKANEHKNQQQKAKKNWKFLTQINSSTLLGSCRLENHKVEMRKKKHKIKIIKTIKNGRSKKMQNAMTTIVM